MARSVLTGVRLISAAAKDTFISELTQLENHRNMNYNDYVKLLRDRTRRAMS